MNFVPSLIDKRLRLINLAVAGIGLAILLAYILISFQHLPPYDYQYFAQGAHLFCFDNAHFSFSEAYLYPAPFYTAFCLPDALAPQLWRWVWMLTPFFIGIWLAKGRAAVLAYPPLFLLLLLGQSTWLVLPLFILATYYHRGGQARWWHSVFLALAIFKPHIAFPAALYVLWCWRQRPRILLAAAFFAIALVLPSFILRPTWVQEWLATGRTFRAVSMASVAYIPVNLFQLDGAASQTGVMMVWGFSLFTGFLLYILFRWRRGGLDYEDWLLLVLFVNPTLHDYDLIILLPMLVVAPKRLLIALVAGMLTWVYALLTAITPSGALFNMSFLITFTFVFMRLWPISPRRNPV